MWELGLPNESEFLEIGANTQTLLSKNRRGCRCEEALGKRPGFAFTSGPVSVGGGRTSGAVISTL